MVNQAVILAGGAGVRMKGITPNAKCLLEIRHKTILEMQIEFFVNSGVDEILLLLGYNSDDVSKVAQALARKYRINVVIEVEDEPLGTGGALLNALSKLQEAFYVTHGDLVLQTSLKGFDASLVSKHFDVALLYHPTNHPEDSDLLVIRNHEEVIQIVTKPHSNFMGRCLGNAGLYAFKKNALIGFNHNSSSQPRKIDLDRELLPALLEKGLKVGAIRNLGFVKDLGTPERFKFVEENWDSLTLKSGLRPAIFLDRDGTLNELRGFITDPSEIFLAPDGAKFVSEVKNLGFWVIIITNQPVIARGEVSIAGLDEIHGKLERELLKEGTIVDDFFFCPHHPDSGFEGEISELKVPCKCRKPEVGLIERALEIYPVDLEKSWMIGDSWRDIELAKSAGIKSIFLGKKESDAQNATHSAKSLTEALTIVRNQI